MAKLDLELYEADPGVEIDIKAAMEGLRNEALIFAKLLDALVEPDRSISSESAHFTFYFYFSILNKSFDTIINMILIIFKIKITVPLPPAYVYFLAKLNKSFLLLKQNIQIVVYSFTDHDHTYMDL